MHRNNSTVPAPDDITAMDAIALSAAIHERDVSCREVMQAYLDRIEQVNPRFNAIVALQDGDQLLAESKTADDELTANNSRGWLHGIPQAPKDLAMTRGIRTTFGSPIFADNIPTEDTVVIERARSEGAILIGKTNTSEFGLGSQTYNNVYGPTRNALNDSLCAGGSSGGAASALALNLLPVADGGDMMGSLRNPGAFNNVYGFRPSAGRVPAGPGVDQFVQQLGVAGPLGRDPRQCARLLATQAGYNVRAPLSLPGDGSEFIDVADYQVAASKPLTGKRVGWLGDMNGYLPMQPGVLERCTLALNTLESLGAVVEPTALNYPPEKLWQTWLTLRQGIQGGALSPFYHDEKRRPLLKPEAQWEITSSLGATAADFFNASAERTRFYLAMITMYENLDFVALPTAQVFPFDVNTHWPKTVNGIQMDTYHRWMEAVLPATMSGLPAINLPVAPSRNDGLANDMTGIQLMGPPQADVAVLKAAISFHSTTSSV